MSDAVNAPPATVRVLLRPCAFAPGQASAAGLDETRLAVLELLEETAHPLTASQIGRALLLPVSEVREIIGELRRCGLVSQLNTLIESYVPARRMPADAAGAAVG